MCFYGIKMPFMIQHPIFCASLIIFVGLFVFLSYERKKKKYTRPVWRDPNNKYVPNWQEISRQTRRNRGYTCEICNINLSSYKNLLHTHHKNRDKRDNSEENLQVLCVECHSEQDGHFHMKQNFSHEIFQVRVIRPEKDGIKIFVVPKKNGGRFGAERSTKIVT
jgi:hypothetical protein